MRYIVESEAKNYLSLPTEDAIDELGSSKTITDEGLHFRNLSYISVILTEEQVSLLRSKGLDPTPEKYEENISLGLDYERVLSLHHKTKKKGIDGSGVKIAVLDSGCNDFATFGVDVVDVDAGYNFIDEQVGWLDDFGHGTRVCSAIKKPITGIAPNCELHAVKMISSFGGTWESAVLASLDYCIDNDIDFINLSWTFDTLSIRDAIALCVDAGIVVCAASGNSTVDAYTLLPAALPDVVAVNAIVEDRTPVYKNIIPPPGDFHGVTVACGGWNTEGYNRTNAYSGGFGTSFACPIFVGALACYKQELQEEDNYKVLDYVLKRILKTESPYFGQGLITF